MKRIFISYNHRDSIAINSIKSARLNQEHKLTFCDRSLANPILNSNNHINRRPPTDSAANPIKKEISSLLDRSDKLLLLVGQDTHSSLWVEWEINAFVSKHGNKDIIIMRVHGNTTASLPKNISAIKSIPIHNWNLNLLSDWAK
ncbi:TIR domain-containing protein [Photobacterium carnosum]|uniref:TIR domain-containing protein n=1 Tax=Photobacterium carnosum TaxID=2023717 RepID=UPI00128B8930|nr:TIR domain-containing protein [Photobacterium carnosum]KAE8176524.1 hypothetical protein CIT27_11995 [Photobacterium carnosum]MCD9527020.1 hypothetical protein [Photobacterium carnosum]